MKDYTGSTLDHLNIAVPDLERSLAFYRPVLEVLGLVELLQIPADPDEPRAAMHGFGWTHKPYFWLIGAGTVGTNMHIAFTATSREVVRRFYEVALACGGRSHLEPGVRPEYHADYYGGFVFDPDGINVEAVHHQPAAAQAG